jgi:ankyrin repeat protein
MLMRATILVLLAAVFALPAAAQTPAKRDTRLVDALKAGDTAAALTLLSKRIDVNAAEPDGTTALHWAVRLDDLNLVNRLIRAGANVKASNRYGRAPARGRRERQRDGPVRRDGADGLCPHG